MSLELNIISARKRTLAGSFWADVSGACVTGFLEHILLTVEPAFE
jgi:hypothetical protein